MIWNDRKVFDEPLSERQIEELKQYLEELTGISGYIYQVAQICGYDFLPGDFKKYSEVCEWLDILTTDIREAIENQEKGRVPNYDIDL